MHLITTEGGSREATWGCARATSDLLMWRLDLFGKSEGGKGVAALLGTRVAYASQAWLMPEHKIIYTLGSYGQVGFSQDNFGTALTVIIEDTEFLKLVERVGISSVIAAIRRQCKRDTKVAAHLHGLVFGDSGMRDGGQH